MTCSTGGRRPGRFGKREDRKTASTERGQAMLQWTLANIRDRRLTILCLGAHSDDIEIGCGGTILKLLESEIDIAWFWVVLSGNAKRRGEAVKSAKTLLKHAAEKHIVVKSFKDGYFPYHGAAIKDYFESLKKVCSPDIIFTHYRNDLHQDHRLVSDLTWNTFRNHLILEYESPKYDGDMGSPGVFVHLEESVCRGKVNHILSSFRTQAHHQWFTEETFRSILRLRGIESNAPGQYAEAFYSRKSVLTLR
jgi:LmbE family N-acetylglucosaminyl deacetylase